jgi:epoxyqueuosine reductase QueG
MYETITKTANEYGFARVYFTELAKLSDWREGATAAGVGAALEHDATAAYPWASCVMLLVYPYLPYAQDERIPAYYVAQNAAYNALGELAERLSASLGKRFERAVLPMRAIAVKNGIGVQGKNGLLRLDPYGSRIALFAFATDAVLPQAVTDSPSKPCPAGCKRCAAACPAGAIATEPRETATFLTQNKCMRYYMDKTPYPKWVFALQKKHMGCEACMDACPINFHLPAAEPSQELREAFDLDRLISGDTKEARRYVGRNMTGGGKLMHEAENFKSRTTAR